MNISCKNIHYAYEKIPTLYDLNIEIKSGAFVTIIGPSGCGKTTLLKLLAGLLPMQEGSIYFDTIDVSASTPQKRDVSMVFQNYALFPHMTVIENVVCGLKNKDLSRMDRLKYGQEMLEKVGLSTLENTSIQSLSGGQQQRVALARAMVLKPSALLFDEPLSNLDQLMKVQMRREIRRLQQESSITTLYVTHDQEEAMAISDHIVVMDEGRIVQVGTPEDIYQRPATPFVASFMGIVNIIEMENKSLIFRPEKVIIHLEGQHQGHILWKEYLGNIIRLGIHWKGKDIICEHSSNAHHSNEIKSSVTFDFKSNTA